MVNNIKLRVCGIASARSKTFKNQLGEAHIFGLELIAVVFSCVTKASELSSNNLLWGKVDTIEKRADLALQIRKNSRLMSLTQRFCTFHQKKKSG